MFCPKCGKSIVESAAFCKYCGAKILRRSSAREQGPSQGRGTAKGPAAASGRQSSGRQSSGRQSSAGAERKGRPQQPSRPGGSPKKTDANTVRAMAAAAIVLVLIAAIGGTAYAVSPARRASRQVSIGDRYLSELDYDQAIVAYENAISIDPKSEDAYKGVVDAALRKAEKLEEEEADDEEIRDLYEKAADAIVRADEEEIDILLPPEVIDDIETHLPEDHPIHTTKEPLPETTTEAETTETETETATETETETETVTETETETETETVTETETETQTETRTETETTAATETATETEEVPAAPVLTWQEAYRTYIGENRQEGRQDLYALGFVDGDEIPEMFHTSFVPEYGEGFCQILTFVDGRMTAEDATGYENLLFKPHTGQLYVSRSDGEKYEEGLAVYRNGHIETGDMMITDSGTGLTTWKGEPVDEESYYVISDELYASVEPGQPVMGFFNAEEMLAYMDMHLPAGSYDIGWARGDGGMMGLLQLAEDGTYSYEGPASVLSDDLPDEGEEITDRGTYQIENSGDITKARIVFRGEAAGFSFPYIGMTEEYRYLHYENEALDE